MHYVVEHGVRLPRDFEEYAIQRMDDLESAEVDRAWWTARRGQ